MEEELEYWSAMPAHTLPGEALAWVIRGCVMPGGPHGGAADAIRSAYGRGVLGKAMRGEGPDTPPDVRLRLQSIEDAAYRLGRADAETIRAMKNE